MVVGGQMMVLASAHEVEVTPAPEKEDLVVVVVLGGVAKGMAVDGSGKVGVPIGEIGRAERAGGGAER